MQIIRRALGNTFSSMGTTALALSCGLLGFVASAIIRLYRDGWAKGWPAVKASLAGDAGIGLIVAVAAWLIVFLVSLGRALEERKGNGDDHARVSPDLRSSTLLLVAEIGQFATERSATEPTGPVITRTGLEALAAAATTKQEKVAHFHETNRLYYERFGRRVVEAREQLAQRGIIDPGLDDIYLTPSLLAGTIVLIAQRLRTMAQQLPLSLGDARGQLAAIQARRLNDVQRAVIVAKLTPVITAWTAAGHKALVRVSAAPACGDCDVYARDFEALFKSTGMTVHADWWRSLQQTFQENDPGVSGFDDLRAGLTVRYSSGGPHASPPYVLEVINALRAANIEVRVLDRTGIFFDFIVGSRE